MACEIFMSLNVIQLNARETQFFHVCQLGRHTSATVILYSVVTPPSQRLTEGALVFDYGATQGSRVTVKGVPVGGEREVCENTQAAERMSFRLNKLMGGKGITHQTLAGAH